MKWYEKPEDWDRLCPAEDDADIDDMNTRHRELYSSFLRLDKLKKMTTTKNNDKISSDQKKEIQDEARRVELLLNEYDSLWMEQGWSRARSKAGQEAQATSTSLTSDPVKIPRPTKTKSRKPQTGVENSVRTQKEGRHLTMRNRSTMTSPSFVEQGPWAVSRVGLGLRDPRPWKLVSEL
jgi:hypothetical protein